MTITVVGAGKMGLPLACQFARRGGRVIACDIDTNRVDTINRGESPIDEPGVGELVRALVPEGRLTASTDTAAAVGRSDAVVVIVPALLTAARDVDARALTAACRDIARTLRPGTLVSIETTLPVGGTRTLLLPVLEAGGLRAGGDFDLAFSPERVKSLSVLRQLEVTPKIVGGITPPSAQRAAAFYGEFLGAPVLDVGTLEAAELAKLAGMLYRDVNIALANELARYAEAVGVDLPALIPAINTDGESALLHPGVGVGGHCTPVYPHFLIRDAARAGAPAALAARARRINDGQAAHVLDRLEQAWGALDGQHALILGLAFRPGVREHLLSPAFPLRDELVRRGARVSIHDPLYAGEELIGLGFTPHRLDPAHLPPILVLNTAHREYLELDFASLAHGGVRAVVDGRNVWDRPAVESAGLCYVGIGRPPRRASAFPRALPIARPLLQDEEAEAAADVVRSGWIMQGPQVSALEREFAAFVGAPHACAVSSGTAALHLALLAVGVGAGDEVVTVSHSYIATANSIRHCGATPVFVDILPDTLNIDPDAVLPAITPRTKAILCVHQLGMPCDLRALVAMARARGLRLVEDAACAVGSEVQLLGTWQRLGRPHGDAACFSFHPRKLVTTGDGGMITTADAEIDRRVRRWRQHGLEPAGSGPHAQERFLDVGFNYRMTDVQAAIGREQLAKLPALLAERRDQVALYRRVLAPIPGLHVPDEPGWARSNWQTLMIRLPAGCSQDAVIAMLAARSIGARRGITNAHEQPAFAGSVRHGLPHSERAQREHVALPLFPGLTATEIARVAAVLADAVPHAVSPSIATTS